MIASGLSGTGGAGRNRLDIGYVYGFNSYPPAGGGGVHVFNLVKNLVVLGNTVHAFEPESNKACTIYPATPAGIEQFLNAIDLLYVRIDGSFLSESVLKQVCLRDIGNKPVVWEINSPTDEILARLRYTASQFVGASNPLLRRFKSTLRDMLYQRRVANELQLRRKLGKRVNGAVCVSEALRNQARDDLKIQKCITNPNGSDPELFSGASQSDLLSQYKKYFKVMYAGASQWFWQGTGLVAELSSRAARRGDDILFIVLDYSKTSTRGKWGDNVLVMDPVEQFQVPRYLAAADVCLCLYADFAWSRHGFYLSPLKLYDYMAAGRTVIASDKGQISTVIEDGRDGFLVSDDADEILDRILFCRDNPELVAKVGAAARKKIIENFTWMHTAKATMKLFESL
jgi:glycosyltransferase involved in cell wall biosynthesis